MENQPLVSIIIPTYNRAHLIGETLDSVLAQTYQNWECIIVDDGSNDNTDDVVGSYVKKDNRFKFFHRPDEHLPGGNGARNYGFKMSQGEYVNWFDDDDLMLNKLLEFHLKQIQSQNAELSICDLNVYFENSIAMKKWLSDEWKYLDYNHFCEGYLMFKYRLITSCFMWKKNFLKQKKLFSEKLLRSQEYEFFCRVFLTYQPKITKCKEILILYRQHEENKISQAKMGNIHNLKSGLIAKQMVIGYVKETIGMTKILRLYFINDALSYLQYDYKNVYSQVSKILLKLGISNTKTFIKNYRISSSNKIDIYDLRLYQLNSPQFILSSKYLIFKFINKLNKKIKVANT